MEKACEAVEISDAGPAKSDVAPGSRELTARGYLYLQHDVGVVIGLDVVEADDSRQVGGPIVGSVQFALLIQPCNVLLRERWLQHVLWKKAKQQKTARTYVQLVLAPNIYYCSRT